LWLAQGKTNGEIAIILGNSESTVKKHVLEIFLWKTDGRNPDRRQPAGARSSELSGSRELIGSNSHFGFEMRCSARRSDCS
jgi:transposase